MKNILTTAIFPLLAGLAFSCSSSTALHTTETDDLYYASSDRTTRPAPNYAATEEALETGSADNPEYGYAEGGQTSVTNNYNYYNSNRYATNYGGSRFRNYNYYAMDPFYDPFYSPFGYSSFGYSPFGYSAAYCYNMFDPFCYPSRGLTISIGYGWGGPMYGGFYGHRPYGYGYRPYDYYGYGSGYGSYYHGFYDGYYAGGGGYGYGYNRQRVNYAPRTNRSAVPNGSVVNGSGGRPASPGREAQNVPGAGSVIPGSRPARVAQPGTPGQVVGQPANNNNARPQDGRQQEANRPALNQRPARDGQKVQPENYQFQNTAPQQQIEYNRPARNNAVTPSGNDRVPVQQQAKPARPEPQQAPVQIEQPTRREQRRMQRTQPAVPQPSQQRSAPVYENSRPSRSNNSGSYQAPSQNRNSGGSFSSPSRSGSNSGGGRPRR